MGRDISPDDPEFAQVVEELSREEAERVHHKLVEEERDLEPSDEPEADVSDEVESVEIPGEELMNEDAMEKKTASPESGSPETPTTYDPVLGQIGQIAGYNPDMDYPNIAGKLVDEKVRDDEVMVVYQLTDSLLDTSGDAIVQPGIEFTDPDYLNHALEPEQEELHVEIDNESGYKATITYDNPDDIEEAVNQVATAIVELDQELNQAYRSAQ